VPLITGGPAANLYDFRQAATGYPCRSITVRGGRANPNSASAGSGFADLFADTNSTNILADSFGSWATPPVISSPPAQTTIINPTVANASTAFSTTAPSFAAAGLSGATAASRYAGATISGHPATGTWAAGDWVIDQAGTIWICTAAGTPGTWATVSTGNPWEVQPSDIGVVAWTASPAKNPVSVKPAGAFAGVLLMWLFRVPQPATISKISYSLVTAGASVANAFLGIYSAGTSATLLAQSATDQSSNLAGTPNAYTATLSAPLGVSPGLYRVGLLIGSATTMPTFMAAGGANSAAFTNMGITTPANFLSASTGTGQTALPAGPVSSGSFSGANTGLPVFVMS
jgi:hypothetical protein